MILLCQQISEWEKVACEGDISVIKHRITKQNESIIAYSDIIFEERELIENEVGLRRLTYFQKAHIFAIKNYFNF